MAKLPAIGHVSTATVTAAAMIGSRIERARPGAPSILLRGVPLC
jgi:hypothetical protein